MHRKIKVSINTERCKGCGYCSLACPEGIIQMSNVLNSQGHHYAFVVNINKCSGCRFCAVICPDIAIEIRAVELRDEVSR